MESFKVDISLMFHEQPEQVHIVSLQRDEQWSPLFVETIRVSSDSYQQLHQEQRRARARRVNRRNQKPKQQKQKNNTTNKNKKTQKERRRAARKWRKRLQY